MMKLIKNFFLKKYVNRLDFPEFKEDRLIRYHLVFIGKVQNVGFRDQIRLFSEKLDLTGYVRNICKNKVICEIQGTKEKLDFLVNAVKNEKRFVLNEINQSIIFPITEEEFIIIKI